MRLANGRVAGKQYIGTEGLLILGRTELVARDELAVREAGECIRNAEHVRPQREGQFVPAAKKLFDHVAMLEHIQVNGACVQPQHERLRAAGADLHGQ